METEDKIEVVNAPQEIWLNVGDLSDSLSDEVDFYELRSGGDVSWCNEQIEHWDVRYVRADLYDERAKEIERLTAELAAAKALVPRWIPVSERLPSIPEGKHAVSVMAAQQCCGGRHAECADDWYIATASYGDDGAWHFWNMDGEPTHWMPLPPAPGEGNG